MASISWVADSPLWRMFSRFVFALVGPESSSSNTVASTADHSDQPKIVHKYLAMRQIHWSKTVSFIYVFSLKPLPSTIWLKNNLDKNKTPKILCVLFLYCHLSMMKNTVSLAICLYNYLSSQTYYVIGI